MDLPKGLSGAHVANFEVFAVMPSAPEDSLLFNLFGRALQNSP
jgi:hypothetical protein